MSRIVFLIDGFNLYHALDYFEAGKDHWRYHKYKWLSLSRLAKSFVPNPADTIEDIYYFTTLAFWDPKKVARHKTYIRAQELEGVNVVYGEFKKKEKPCKLCRQRFPTVEEKQTDVNIAIHLLQLAVENKYDKAIIISGDTDYLPAVRAVKSSFPHKKIGVVVPIGKRSDDFRRQADFSLKMREIHLKSSRLPDTITTTSGRTLSCPPQWLEEPYNLYPEDKPAITQPDHHYHSLHLKCASGITLSFMYSVTDELKTHKIDTLDKALVRACRLVSGDDRWELIEIKNEVTVLYNKSTLPLVVDRINRAITNDGLSIEDAALRIAREDGHM